MIAESFAEIFFGNCTNMGVPCFVVSEADCEAIFLICDANNDNEISLEEFRQGVKKVKHLFMPST